MSISQYKNEVGLEKSLCLYKTYNKLCDVMNEAQEEDGYKVVMEEFLLYFAHVLNLTTTCPKSANLEAVSARVVLAFKSIGIKCELEKMEDKP